MLADLKDALQLKIFIAMKYSVIKKVCKGTDNNKFEIDGNGDILVFDKKGDISYIIQREFYDGKCINCLAQKDCVKQLSYETVKLCQSLSLLFNECLHCFDGKLNSAFYLFLETAEQLLKFYEYKKKEVEKLEEREIQKNKAYNKNYS